MRSSVGARVAIRPSVPESGEALEVTQGNGDRGSLAESDEAGLERDPGREAAGTGQAEPRALCPREGPRADPNEARARPRGIEGGVIDPPAPRGARPRPPPPP